MKTFFKRWAARLLARDEFFFHVSCDGSKFESRGRYSQVMSAYKKWDEMMWESAPATRSIPKKQDTQPAPQKHKPVFNGPRLNMNHNIQSGR